MILNNPIINPSNTAYLTPIIDIAIDVIIPTTIASIIWLDKNLKNISFELLKYLESLLYVPSLNIAFENFFINFNISALCSNI